MWRRNGERGAKEFACICQLFSKFCRDSFTAVDDLNNGAFWRYEMSGKIPDQIANQLSFPRLRLERKGQKGKSKRAKVKRGKKAKVKRGKRAKGQGQKGKCKGK